MTKVDIYSKKHCQLMTDERKEKLFDYFRQVERNTGLQVFLDFISLPTPKDFVLLLGNKPDKTMGKIDRLLELTA